MNTSKPVPVIGVLISGGLDSSILVAKLLDEGCIVQPFFVRSGLRWEACELTATERFLNEVNTPTLRRLVLLEMPLQDVYTDHWSITGSEVPDANSPDEAVYLPGRNALLFIKAAIWCQLNGVSQLALASLGTSPFPDASAEFIRHFQAMINLGGAANLGIALPFSQLTKRQVMEIGRIYPLHLTFSCISPIEGRHCSLCNKCFERQQAFRDAGLPDRTPYATEPAHQR